MLKSNTKTKRKPKCSLDATACGFACISGKFSCRDVVDKNKTSQLLSIFGIGGSKSKKMGKYNASDNADMSAKGFAAFDSASSGTLKLIGLLPKPKYITENKDDKAGVSAFNLRIDGKSAIYIGSNIDLESLSGRMMYRHEYGHHIDGELGTADKFFSESPQFKRALVEDLAERLEGEKDPQLANWAVISAVNESQNYSVPEETMDKWASSTETLALVAGTILGEGGVVLDLLGCLTSNKIGSGHTDEYLSKPGKGGMEVFANLFALHSQGNKLSKAAAMTFAPRAYKEMLKALGE